MLERRLFYCALFILIVMAALAAVLLFNGSPRFESGTQTRSYVDSGRLL